MLLCAFLDRMVWLERVNFRARPVSPEGQDSLDRTAPPTATAATCMPKVSFGTNTAIRMLGRSTNRRYDDTIVIQSELFYQEQSRVDAQADDDDRYGEDENDDEERDPGDVLPGIRRRCCGAHGESQRSACKTPRSDAELQAPRPTGAQAPTCIYICPFVSGRADGAGGRADGNDESREVT